MTPWESSGLSAAEIQEIEDVIRRAPGVSEVILFGSRALGTAKSGSDIDLAIRCTLGASPGEAVRALSTVLNEETALPYRFDVIALELTSHQELLEHIRHHGRVVWR